FVKYDTNSYLHYSIKIKREQYDYDEIYISVLDTREQFIKLNYLYSFIDTVYEKYQIVKLDLLATFNILNRRIECVKVNPDYTKEQIKKIVKYYLSFNNTFDFDTFEQWVY